MQPLFHHVRRSRPGHSSYPQPSVVEPSTSCFGVGMTRSASQAGRRPSLPSRSSRSLDQSRRSLDPMSHVGRSIILTWVTPIGHSDTAMLTSIHVSNCSDDAQPLSPKTQPSPPKMRSALTIGFVGVTIGFSRIKNKTHLVRSALTIGFVGVTIGFSRIKNPWVFSGSSKNPRFHCPRKPIVKGGFFGLKRG